MGADVERYRKDEEQGATEDTQRKTREESLPSVHALNLLELVLIFFHESSLQGKSVHCADAGEGLFGHRGIFGICIAALCRHRSIDLYDDNPAADEQRQQRKAEGKLKSVTSNTKAQGTVGSVHEEHYIIPVSFASFQNDTIKQPMLLPTMEKSDPALSPSALLINGTSFDSRALRDSPSDCALAF